MTDWVDLSVKQARRMALAAQGFHRPRPGGNQDVRHLRRVLASTHQLQIDSVYVLERAHYVPVYSRLGSYSRDIVDKVAYGDMARRELFEYWAHCACLLPVELFPLLRWRMREARQHAWGEMKRVASRDPELVERLYQQVAERGPVSARMLEEDGARRSRENWGWNWSETKHALEWLFRCGRVSVASRPAFERHYDLTERVVPSRWWHAPEPGREDAIRELTARAVAGLGVADEAEIRDFFGLPAADTRKALHELREEGRIRLARVEGWAKPAHLHADAQVPRRMAARALLSPFDPLVRHRERTQRLWDFFYRIEIYVPRAKRVHGYYVLPFLLGDQLVGRVDLKADRAAGVLRVPAAWREEHADRAPHEVATELAAELEVLADWLGLSHVEAPVNGSLASELTAALAAS